MASRDRFSIRPGSENSSQPNRVHEPASLPMKATSLLHRLRDAQPNIRLVRDEVPQTTTAPASSATLATPSAPSTPAAPARSNRQTITDPADPRWVLALRTAESLQGTILGPEKRERLVKVGKLMGLTAFDANLVIAIVQDQARRGYAPEYCPTAGEPQLAMVPLPKRELSEDDARTRRIGIICGVITLLVGLEIIILKWLFS